MFKKKHKLTIDFHRGRPLVLPFYDEQDQTFSQEPMDVVETDDEEQYEWDDVW